MLNPTVAKELFAIGDRVQFSEKGKATFTNRGRKGKRYDADGAGVVTGYSRDGSCIRIRFGDRKTENTWHCSYFDKVDKVDKVEGRLSESLKCDQCGVSETIPVIGWLNINVVGKRFLTVSDPLQKMDAIHFCTAKCVVAYFTKLDVGQ